jgi:O-antigen/teichoic acid export membrane protein
LTGERLRLKPFHADVGASALSQVVFAAAQLVVQVTAVRMLGIPSYGVYAACLAVITLLELGILPRSHELALKYVGQAWVGGDYSAARRKARTISRSDIRWAVGIFGVVVLLAMPLASAAQLDASYLILLALVIPLQAGYGVAKAVLVVSGGVRAQATIEILASLAFIATGVAGVYFLGVWGLILGNLVTAITRNVAARYAAGRAWPESASTVAMRDPLPSGSALESARAVARSLSNGAADQVDLLIVNALAGSQAAGVYKIAKSVATLPVRAVGPLWTALRPRLVQRWLLRDYRRALSDIARVSGLLVASMAVWLPLLYLAGEELLQFAFGSAAATAFVPMLLLTCGYWVAHGATAWFRVLVPIESVRLHALAQSVLLLCSVVVCGLAWGGKSPQAMAGLVCALLIFFSIGAWLVTLSFVASETRSQ